jgi:hypothetical protein
MAARRPAERPSSAGHPNNAVWDHVFVPSKREIFKSHVGWAPPGTRRVQHQATVPNDPQLLEKLGIAKGARILVFAGCFGDWTKALSKGANVAYTDVSKPMTRYAKKRFRRSKIESFRAREASLQPRRKNRYDWSFSFQPYPLQHTTMPLALVRSLLNRKGAIIIPPSSASPDLDVISKIYGASLKIEKSYITTILGASETVWFATLRTNPKAKRMAWQDLRVLNAIDKLEEIDSAALAKKLGIPKEQFLESIHRIWTIAGFAYDYSAGIVGSKKILR